MSEAKRRGTFEQRQAEGVDKRLAREKAEVERRAARKSVRSSLTVAGILAAMGHGPWRRR